jgi:hypothetical protein
MFGEEVTSCSRAQAREYLSDPHQVRKQDRRVSYSPKTTNLFAGYGAGIIHLRYAGRGRHDLTQSVLPYSLHGSRALIRVCKVLQVDDTPGLI